MKAGETLAKQENIRPLGKGGLGEVYVDADLRLYRQVAFKGVVQNEPRCQS